MTDIVKIKSIPKDCFWAIRPMFKASLIRGTELIFLSFYLFITQSVISEDTFFFGYIKKDFYFWLIIGLLIITSFSYIFYKSYEILAERIKKHRQQTWIDVKEMSKYFIDACFYRMKRFYKNTTAKLKDFIKKRFYKNTTAK